MPKIKLNLSALTVPEKIAKARQIVTKMTGNAHFPTPTPNLVAVSDAADFAENANGQAQDARQTAKQKTSALNQAEDRLDKLLNQIAGYVESIAGGDEQTILSAGMDVRAVAVATTDTPGQPQALTPTVGDRDGEIDLSWDTVTGAKSYVIDRSPMIGRSFDAQSGREARSLFPGLMKRLVSGSNAFRRKILVVKRMSV